VIKKNLKKEDAEAIKEKISKVSVLGSGG